MRGSLKNSDSDANKDVDQEQEDKSSADPSENETTPTEIPVRQVTAAYRVKRDVGAVQPVWIMVRVPADAAPGEYEAKLTIHPAGADPVVVPVHLTVCPFRLPDTKDYVTWTDFIQSPESLSLAYKVPLWSDAHFRLIGKSFRLLACRLHDGDRFPQSYLFALDLG